MREWPSIVPGAPEDYNIVVNHYGRFGTAFAETDLDRANYETTIADLMAGQHSDPLRVVMFNPRPIAPKMSRTPWPRSCGAATGLKCSGSNDLAGDFGRPAMEMPTPPKRSYSARVASMTHITARKRGHAHACREIHPADGNAEEPCLTRRSLLGSEYLPHVPVKLPAASPITER